jgi:hypothetical protein
MARGAGAGVGGSATDVESVRTRYAGAMDDVGGACAAVGSHRGMEGMDVGLLRGRDSVKVLKDMR